MRHRKERDTSLYRPANRRNAATKENTTTRYT